MSREIEVLLQLGGSDHLVGRLYTTLNRGIERATLTLDRSWLTGPHAAAFTRQFDIAQIGSNPLGALSDSAPDRWGRELMKLAERREAKKAERAPRTLYESDFLLGVDDASRIGALRFRDPAKPGEYLSPGGPNSIPPFLSLPKLLQASQSVFDEDPDGAYLKYLLRPGASVGGARPKAVVRGTDGALLIAKFPKPDSDHINIPAWEQVALNLYRMTGANTAVSQLRGVANRQVILLERFDRDGQERIPYLSAMSMLGAADGETRSYLEMVDIIRQTGAPKDITELFRRMVNNVLLSNRDDHMRNHGFLYRNGTWELSPAFDINPVPAVEGGRYLSTALTIEDTEATIENCIEAADYIGLKRPAVNDIIERSAKAISQWRAEAQKLNITPSQIDAMASAFEHREMENALNLKVVNASKFKP